MALIPLNTFKTKTAVLTTATYNQARCFRDSQLIVDSIAFDLLYSGQTQSIFAGLQYWAQGASKIPGEVFQTLSALQRAEEVCRQIVIGQPVSRSPGNSAVQDIAPPYGNSAGQARITEEFNLISRIIRDGTSGITDDIIPNGDILYDNNLIDSADILYRNKEFLQEEILAFLKNTFTEFNYDVSKCARDTRLVVDSLAFDLLSNGSTQSEFAGLQYWAQGEIKIQGETAQTLAAIEYVKDMAMGLIISNDPSATFSESFVGLRFDEITNIIRSGTEGVSDIIEPNGNATSNSSILTAYNYLQTNKSTIQSDTVSWINSQISNNIGIWNGFIYDSVKCSRDIGYMIDSVCFDLKYGGNRQTIQAGVYYYGFSTTTTSVPTEQEKSVIAYNYLKSLLDDIITSTEIQNPYQSTVGQTLSAQTGTLDEASFVKSKIDTITSVITNGPTIISTERTPISLILTSDIDVVNSATLLLANKEFLAAEVTAFVDQVFRNFYYEKTKCARDTGLVVDSIAFDLVYPGLNGNTQSIFAGLQYWGQGNTSIPEEAAQTKAAITYLKNYISTLILSNDPSNVDIKLIVTTLFDEISYIIENGTVGSTDRVRSNGDVSTDSSVLAVYQIMQDNKAAAQAAVINWINAQILEGAGIWGGFVYNSATCSRDVGYIIDCISFDLKHGGNRQTIQAGVYYYGFSNTVSSIPTDKVQSVAAYDYLKSILSNIITGTKIIRPYQVEVSQITNLPAATSTEVALAEDCMSDIINIIEQGPDIIGDKEPIVQERTVDSNAEKAFSLLLANKQFIQQEVIAFVDHIFFNSYRYNRAKCKRDTQLIIDSVAFDLFFEGTTQIEFAGLQYWSQGNTTVPNEVFQTISAIEYLKTISQEIVVNTSIVNSSTNTLTQFINTATPGSISSANTIGSNFDLIINIMRNGTSGITDLISPNGDLTTDEGYQYAYTLLQTNKRFIQTEIVAWISDKISAATSSTSAGSFVVNGYYKITTLGDTNWNTIAGTSGVTYAVGDVIKAVNAGSGSGAAQNIWYDFEYNSETCFRDVGYIVDCICFDLVYGGNRQSIQAGAYYYGFSEASSSIPNERSEAMAAFNYLKTIIDDVITAQPIGYTYQTNVKQVILQNHGSVLEANSVKLMLNTLNNIIDNGPSVVGPRKPISLESSLSLSIEYAYNILLANRDFLAEEVVAYVDTITGSTFEFDQTLCRRDVGYIVDCVTFDIQRGGNRQAVQAGVYYYDHSSSVSIVPTEKTDTINAYTHFKNLLPYVIRATDSINNIPVTLYQSDVRQNKDLPASTSLVAEDAQALITKINTIIDKGPANTVVSTDRRPITRNMSNTADVAPSTDINVVRAFNLLLANRKFLAAEMVGYLNQLKTPNTTKIYTAPPGVTSIILLAQVANVSDHEIDVTLAHYRNLPVLADPSTSSGYQPGDTLTEIVKGFTVPSNDSASLINGKMILESFDSVVAYASEGDGIKITLSILETANA